MKHISHIDVALVLSRRMGISLRDALDIAEKEFPGTFVQGELVTADVPYNATIKWATGDASCANLKLAIAKKEE